MSLRDYLREHGELPLNDAVAILNDVAEAAASCPRASPGPAPLGWPR
ncbi:hypothetical protein ACPMJQ_28490 [Streptomyces pseudogriseolus]